MNTKKNCDKIVNVGTPGHIDYEVDETSSYKSDLLLRKLEMNVKSGFVEIPKLETAEEFYEWLHSQ